MNADRIARQRTDELGQKAGGNGDRALFFYLGADPAADSHFQIGGNELEAAAIGGQ